MAWDGRTCKFRSSRRDEQSDLTVFLCSPAHLSAGDGRGGGSGRYADEEPFCGALEAHEKGSAVCSGCGSVALALQGCGARFFVGQILLKRLDL